MPEPTQPRPITLYVVALETEIQADYIGRDRNTAVDIELTREVAENLAIYLNARIREIPSSNIRFRVSGKLVMS